MVVFFIAYEQFALEGFNLNVVDYLLKPVSFDRFLKAVNKAHELFALKNNPSAPVESLEYLFVNAEYSLVKITIRDILYIEGLKDYIKIFVADATRPIITRMRMKSMEEKLPTEKFISVHKSYIVSVEKIVSIRRGKISIGNVHIPVSEHYKENLGRFIDPTILH